MLFLKMKRFYPRGRPRAWVKTVSNFNGNLAAKTPENFLPTISGPPALLLINKKQASVGKMVLGVHSACPRQVGSLETPQVPRFGPSLDITS